MSYHKIVKNHTKSMRFFVLLGIYVAALFIYKPFMILLPGILFYRFYVHHNNLVSQALGFSLLSTIAFWVTVFPVLKFIPISYTSLIVIVSTLTGIICALMYSQSRSSPSPQWKDAWILISFLCLFFLYFRMYGILTAPPGGDMVTHAYNARVVIDKNAYPHTYEPVIPIKTYGFSPTGFGSVAGAIGLLTPLDASKASLFVSLMAYPLLGIALFLLLTVYFSPLASILTVFLVLISANDIRGYLSWGGNTSVLSIALLTTGVAIIAKYIERGIFDKNLIGLLCMFFVSSFLTHPIPVVAFGYAIIPILFNYLLTSRTRIFTLKFILLVSIVCTILLIPFLTSIKLPSQDTLAQIRGFSTTPSPFSIQGTWATSIIHVPEFVMNRIGELFFVLFLTGIIIGVNHKHAHTRWYVSASFVLFFLLLNSKHWILPLSEILYPDRVLGTAIILYAFFTGLVIQTITNVLNNLRWNLSSAIAGICLLLWLPYLFIYLFINPYKNIVRVAIDQTQVTTNDMRAFRWINLHISSNEVFLNNVGDAGIWIPIFTGRKVIWNDAAPQDFDELFEAQSKLIPAYVYVGDKVVYPERMHFDIRQLHDRQKYTLVYQSGNAKIYKINQ